MRQHLLLLLALTTGCSSEDPASATIVLTAGQETDAFTRDPAPQRLVLQAVSTSGATEQMLDIAWPTSGFEIGDYNPDQVVAFEAFGRDATGQDILRGATIYHALWTLDGANVPMFMGRLGELSRPSGVMTSTRVDGVAAVVDARFIVSVGGTDASGSDGSDTDPAAFAAYDLGLWSASPAIETFPRNPKSLAMVLGRYGLAIDDGGASWFDFATYGAVNAEPPEGLSFSEVAGGEVIYGEDGESYVVGPTRMTDPSSAVLRINAEGVLSVVRLPTARVGAAASYVPNRGLVLIGGHASDPGVLLLQPDATSFAPLAYPADAVTGAGAAVVDEDRVLLAGGSDGTTPALTRLLDLSCTSSCAATELGDGLAPPGITDAWARATGPDEVVVVGPSDEVEPSTRFVRIGGLNTIPSVEPVSLREPRVGATPIALFGRSIALVGGRKLDGAGAHSIEVYIPE